MVQRVAPGMRMQAYTFGHFFCAAEKSTGTSTGLGVTMTSPSFGSSGAGLSSLPFFPRPASTAEASVRTAKSSAMRRRSCGLIFIISPFQRLFPVRSAAAAPPPLRKMLLV